MNILILIINIFFSIIYSSEYLWPNDYDGNITATFSEPRPRRFHAGIDVRTFGEIGSNLYAIETGYISRIRVLPNNYGKAIYLKLNDGNIVLYSHLDKFNKEIEDLVKNLYQKYESSFFDHTLSSSEFIKINKGEIIGYTGDTGSISGPHLHFEIRNENNEPVNPLDHYKIIDSTPPLAKSITIIPLNDKTWIDGIQDYKSFDLKKINSNKYVIQDTISAVGEFGIAVETYDEIDDLSFKYGIYKMELLIDNILMYSIQFDNYNFSEDHLIYSAIDFALLQEGKISHRLFNKEENNLSFMKSSNDGRINLDNNFHNLIINILDANNNIMQIQGVIIGELINNINMSLDFKNDRTIIKTEDLNSNKLFLNMASNYENIENSKEELKKISNNTYAINQSNENFNVIEFYIKNENGVKSKKSFLSINKQNPYNIDGEINIKHLDTGLIIEFLEDEHSGYIPKLEIVSNDSIYDFSLYRKEKNILSSSIINIKNIKNISVIYDTKPEIIFNKKVFTLSSLYQKEINFKDYNLSINNNSFYDELLIVCSKKENYKLNNQFIEISEPITIEPNEIPFKEGLILSYNIENCNNCGFYKFSDKKNKWNYINTNNNLKKLTTQIKTGGTFCVLSETEKPIINNLKPRINSKYKKQDLKSVRFNLEDQLSGIDPYKIEIKVDNQNIYFDYIKYRNLVNADLENLLSVGEHTIEISISDKLKNIKNIKGNFLILE